MWHDVARIVAEGGASPTPLPALGVVTALLLAIGSFVVAVTGLVKVLPKFHRNQPVTTPAPPPIALNSDSVDADDDWTPPTDLTAAIRQIRMLRRRVKALEVFSIRAKYDPSRIEDGREALTDVKF
ncbi:hypothetical protein [uncultured Jatrophihabitans sp.]|uniref:hypothetical protein n=1 Tax=uncultured Jatrophihabitans sp. TaxID=1610747 RepID=UPI0035CC353C